MQSHLRRQLSRQILQVNKAQVLSTQVLNFSQYNYYQYQQKPKYNPYMLLGGSLMAAYLAKTYMTSKREAEMGDLLEYEIPFANELKDGEMRPLVINETDQGKVLIVKHQGQIYCTGNFCTHLGAPMHTGALFEDKVVCPWHGAAFNITTGALEAYPAKDPLPKFEVVQKEGKYFVNLPPVLPRKGIAKLAKRDPENKKTFVIVGGGMAGLACAVTLRESDFTGRIVVIAEETLLPYDRTFITKTLPFGDATKWQFQPQEFFDEYGIEFKLGSRAQHINSGDKKVLLADGSSITYDKLCLATGAKPRTIGVIGEDLPNVHKIRTHEDLNAIKEELKTSKDVVIIGGGFISTEAASAIKLQYKDATNVTIVMMEKKILERVLGSELGDYLTGLHTSSGIKVIGERNLKEIKEVDGKAIAVVLDNGQEIKSDLVIMGTGVVPATNYLQSTSSVKLDKDGAVVCDPFLQTDDKDIFAAGDIVSFPYWKTGERIRIEHEVNAEEQGSFAAFNMLGKMIPYGKIPFFWTRNHNKGIIMVGHHNGFDEVFLAGNPNEGPYVAYYIKDNKVIAAAGNVGSKDILTIQEAMLQNLMPSGSEIKSGQETAVTIAEKVKKSKGSKCKREGCCKKKAIQKE